MPGINKVILVGNLGSDPEVSYTPEGKQITNLSLATSEKWKDIHGHGQERTEWHRVVFFDKKAELVAQWAQKGTKLYCEGKLHTNKWTDQQGNDRYSTSVRCRDFEIMAGGVDTRNNPQNPQSPQNPQNPQRPPPRQNSNGTQASPYANNQPPAMEDSYDDDIPF